VVVPAYPTALDQSSIRFQQSVNQISIVVFCCAIICFSLLDTFSVADNGDCDQPCDATMQLFLSQCPERRKEASVTKMKQSLVLRSQKKPSSCRDSCRLRLMSRRIRSPHQLLGSRFLTSTVSRTAVFLVLSCKQASFDLFLVLSCPKRRNNVG
jgi:hypothetical protein